MPTIAKNKRTYAINVRLDEVEYDLLSKLAKAANTERATLLRTYMYEQGAGLDRKHEEQLAAFRKVSNSLEKLHEQLELVAHMCASIAGGVAILPGARLSEQQALEARQNGLAAFSLAEAFTTIQTDLVSKKKG